MQDISKRFKSYVTRIHNGLNNSNQATLDKVVKVEKQSFTAEPLIFAEDPTVIHGYIAEIPAQEAIFENEIIVVFDEVEYICYRVNPEGYNYYYGADWNDDGYNFNDYPFSFNIRINEPANDCFLQMCVSDANEHTIEVFTLNKDPLVLTVEDLASYHTLDITWQELYNAFIKGTTVKLINKRKNDTFNGVNCFLLSKMYRYNDEYYAIFAGLADASHDDYVNGTLPQLGVVSRYYYAGDPYDYLATPVASIK